MADEGAVLDLDKIAEQGTQEEVDAALAKLRQQQQGAGVTDAATGEPSPETPPAEEKPAEAESAPAAEVKPPEKTDEAVEREGRLRRQLREQERLLRQREQELAEERAKRVQAADPAKPPSKDDDPVGYFDTKIQSTEAEIARLRAENQARERYDAIRRQEDEYTARQPDYRKAVAYLEANETKEWQRAGASADIRNLRAAVNAGRNGDQRYAGYASHLDAIKSRPDILELAEKQGQDPEDVAAFLIARDTYLTNRRQMIWAESEATGRNVAEIAYELAQGRGYKNEAQPPASPTQPSPAQTPSAEDAARERVQRAREISAASESLSESGNASGSGPQARVIRNRQQIVNLSDDELDALIQSGQYRNV